MGGGKSQCGVTENVTPTLATTHGGEPVVLENHPNDSRVKIREDGTVQTLSSRMGTGGGNVPMVMEAQSIESHGKDSRYKLKGQINQSLTSCMEHDAANGGLVMDNIQSIGHDIRSSKFTDDEITVPLTATDYKDPIKVSYKQTTDRVYGLDRASFNQGMNAKYNFAIDEEKIGCQTAKGPGAVCNSVVRRLTPLECERLQGFPDGWTDIGEWIDSKGKKHKDADSPRYKALGNSIALPFWQWMAEKMVKHLNNPTMGSLFDGIGGFPLVYSRVGCQPIWASEIEEFPMAVTKIRFPDNEVTQ